MVINKAQRQSLKEVGTDLSEGCFFTYMACSKVGFAEVLLILAPTKKKCSL
jgi:hypothetical protein